MLKSHKFLPYLFGTILLLILAGFYKTYFGLFPSFTGLPKAAHLHAAAMLLWMAMIIIQPILISKGKYIWHKRIGKASYLLVPFIVFTVYLMAKNQYYRDIISAPRETILSDLIFPFSDMFLFVTYYLVAILNTRNTRWHVAFIIGTSLLLLAPGLGRLVYNLSGKPQLVSIIIFSFEYAILIGLVLMERIKLNKKIIGSPYLLLLLLFMMQHAIEIFASESRAWIGIARGVVNGFF